MTSFFILDAITPLNLYIANSCLLRDANTPLGHNVKLALSGWLDQAASRHEVKSLNIKYVFEDFPKLRLLKLVVY